MSNADFVCRKLTFSWSTGCGAKLHYNILASNCGSCPTTTNHTNVTCTNVPTNNSVCIFSIQTVVCGNISGQISYPVRVSVNIANSTVTVLTGLTVSTISPIISYCDCSRLIQNPKLHHYWCFAPNNTTSSSIFSFEIRQEIPHFHTFTVRPVLIIIMLLESLNLTFTILEDTVNNYISVR